MWSELLRILKHAWSGRRDSNPRPLPWQGETPHFTKYVNQPLDPSFRCHFCHLCNSVYFNHFQSNSINLKFRCHLMPPSWRQFVDGTFPQNPRSGNEEREENHRKRLFGMEAIAGPALQGDAGWNHNDTSSPGRIDRGVASGRLGESLPRRPKTISPAPISGPRPLRAPDRVRRAQGATVSFQDDQPRRFEWSQQWTAEPGSDNAWREHAPRAEGL